jgi:hypothetical protein
MRHSVLKPLNTHFIFEKLSKLNALALYLSNIHVGSKTAVGWNKNYLFARGTRLQGEYLWQSPCVAQARTKGSEKFRPRTATRVQQGMTLLQQVSNQWHHAIVVYV